jgi:hydrogenase maturation protein HypF
MPKDRGQKRLRLRLRGVVQGVGMRPFIFRLASEEGLSGFVYNDGQGVVVEAQSTKKNLDRFQQRLRSELPPAARLDDLNILELPPADSSGFAILESPPDGAKFTRLSPDLATCSDCLNELHEPTDRRHHYPFINCTNCGPRLTIIQDVPYDRPRTTMAKFAMCGDCRREYDDPLNRRFHAQPNACFVCGPRVFIIDATDFQEAVWPPSRDSRMGAIRPPQMEGLISAPEAGWPPLRDSIQMASQALKRGEIVAVKGIGGVHLACDASNPSAVRRLRSRKYREERPFALMVRNALRAHQLTHISAAEQELLTSTARPIAILDGKPGAAVAAEISPGLGTIGLMLPYTPLHYLLLASCNLDLVMTSGNLSEEPIAFKDDEIIPRLKGIADLFLLHDRPIHLRCDDSVVRVVRNRPLMLRRSRGYVPDPIRLPNPLKHHILACGAELKNTFCLGRDDQLILSHHLGDLEDLPVLEAFEQGIEHFLKLFYTQPEEMACDLHPDYLSSQYARGRGLPLLEVQHHHAHALACLAEAGDFSPALAWTLDGIGLGTDGTLWGGECLLVNGLQFDVLARIHPVALAGGAKAILEPWRIATAALLSMAPREGQRMAEEHFPGRPVAEIARILETGINCPLSSGAGRLFDAVAALAGIREEIAYEGQAAILLEAETQREHPGILESPEGLVPYSLRISQESGRWIMDWAEMISEVMQDRRDGKSPGWIGARFHISLIQSIVKISQSLREKTGLNRIALTGGVFQNRILLTHVWQGLETAGFDVLVPSEIPINDGGIALGQAAALWLRQA